MSKDACGEGHKNGDEEAYLSHIGVGEPNQKRICNLAPFGKSYLLAVETLDPAPERVFIDQPTELRWRTACRFKCPVLDHPDQGGT